VAKLITAQDLTRWAATAGDGTKYLVMQPGTVMTPGALDAARGLGVQVLHPGPAARTILKRMAEELAGEAVTAADLVKLEASIMAKSKG
jgi:hypothetical protein